ncbi:MAG TPA: hypothetical protein VKU01_27810 [Bryobacteraceae bacterium]|nr:hypothetical protein [Bryobacteraceae bacterium]
MHDDHGDVRVAAGAVDHSMKFVPPRLVAVGTCGLLELSYNFDLVRFRVPADFTELFGHGQPALLLLPRGDARPCEGLARGVVLEQRYAS